jgi:FkbM family methyltransferase
MTKSPLTPESSPRSFDRPARDLRWVRDFVLRMPLAENYGRSLMMAWCIILQSRLLRKYGDTWIVPLGRVRLSLDFRAMHDVRMYSSILRHGGYEPETGRLLAQLLKPGDTFVDVGANNGYFAILASQYVGPAGTILAIEPNPGAVERLRRNVQLNGLERMIQVLPIALGEHEGTGNLSISSFEDGWATLGPYPGSKTVVPVRVAALDDLLEPSESVVMKIDAEGTEPSILRGMSRLCSRVPNVAILLEWNHLFGDQALWDYLHSRFRVFEIVSGAGGEGGLRAVQSFEELRHTFLKNILITSGTRWSTDKASA